MLLTMSWKGIDIPDIEVVVQWRTTCDLNTLWQRFGRAARDLNREAVAVLFVDARYFDDEREEAAKRAQKRKENASKKAAEKEQRKRPRDAEGALAEQGSKRHRGHGTWAGRHTAEAESGVRNMYCLL